jgi:asparagine synthase (glutamine-hydrolysing)
MPQFTEDDRLMRVAVQGTGFGLHLFEPADLPTQLAVARDAARILGHPPEIDCSYLWNPFVKQAAALGVRTILSGNGGDDAVTIPGDLLFRELALRREWGLLRRYRYGSSASGGARALAFIARQPVRRRHSPELQEILLRDLEVRCLTREAVEEFGIRDHVLHLGRWTADHDSINSFILGDRLVGTPSRRAAESNQVAFADKVEYRYPMLDPGLVQTFLSTPSIEKRGPEATRYLHRRAMAGILGDEIRMLEAKNLGTPLPPPPLTDGLPRIVAGDLKGTPVEGLIDGPRSESSRRGAEQDPDSPEARARVERDFRLLLLSAPSPDGR